jgi:hypothetical protein
LERAPPSCSVVELAQLIEEMRRREWTGEGRVRWRERALVDGEGARGEADRLSTCAAARFGCGGLQPRSDIRLGKEKAPAALNTQGC